MLGFFIVSKSKASQCPIAYMRSRFQYKCGMEYSLFVCFFTLLSTHLDFRCRKINRKNNDSTMSLLIFFALLSIC